MIYVKIEMIIPENVTKIGTDACEIAKSGKMLYTKGAGRNER